MTDPTPPVPDPDPASTGRRSAPDEVWARVREDYLDGLSGPACCRRHGVGLSALRCRAAAEGWRRADQPWTPPADQRPVDDPGVELERIVDGYLEDIELGQLSWVAEHRTLLAVLRGDSREALRWRRVRVELDLDEAAVLRRRAHEENLYEARAPILAEREAAEAARQAAGPADLADIEGAAAEGAADPDASDASDASDGVFPGPDRPASP